jgi:hypothetical protein
MSGEGPPNGRHGRKDGDTRHLGEIITNLNNPADEEPLTAASK